MGDRLKKIIANQAEIRERLNSMKESQVWQEDHDAADIANFAEQCLPPEQRSKLNLPNIIRGKKYE